MLSLNATSVSFSFAHRNIGIYNCHHVILISCFHFAAPPKITHISANQTVNKGDNVKLNCTADGNPSPSISWTRLSDNSVVTMPLNRIRRQDEGGYTCTANNGIGNPVSGDVFITVHCKYLKVHFIQLFLGIPLLIAKVS